MASRTAESDSLEQLQSAEQVALLDAIDDLRHQGLGRYDISLPQLIVCGDQSSGKSSLLEGLTRLRFPTKDTVCTTFATELVLREGPKVIIECTITPSRNRTQAQASELRKFRQLYYDHEEFSFPELVDQARKRMGVGKEIRDVFSEDVLKVQYAGPDVPSLTIVDLPGLIHLGEGADKVCNLVRGYMKDPRSIILAVVAANYDLENQVVIKHVQDIDPTSSRTLGIITKPDMVTPGFASETSFVELAMNKKLTFALGWHVVKNRKTEDQKISTAERDDSEKSFFASGIWRSLQRSDVGIDSLRTKLSKCLLRHIRAELPSLTRSIQEAMATAEQDLNCLGESRESYDQQRTYLIVMAERFQHLTRDALRGSYSDPFFAKSSIEGHHKKARLRTEIQNRNIAFAQAMYLKGHKWEITDDEYSSSSKFSSLSSDACQKYDEALEVPVKVSRSTFLAENIGRHVRESRPAGLPSFTNPWVLGTVFKEQAERWGFIAEGHLSYVFSAVQDYINLVVESLMDSRTGMLLKRKHIDAQMATRKEAYEAKVRELLKPFQEGDPIMYDPSFFLELGEIRDKRHLKSKAKVQGNLSQSSIPVHHPLTQTMDDFTNCEILDLMQTYYKRAISVFISNVTVLAIENCLLLNLEQVFAPSLVSRSSEGEIFAIASESEETREKRADLQQKLQSLRTSKEILEFQACDDRTTKFRPTRTKKSSLKPSAPKRVRSRTPTPQPDIRNPDDHSVDINVLAVTPPSSDIKPRRSKVREGYVTPTKAATRKYADRPICSDEALTPPYSNNGDDEEY